MSASRAEDRDALNRKVTVRKLKYLLVAVAMLLPEIGRADILSTLGASLARGAAIRETIREMESFGRSSGPGSPMVSYSKVALDGGYQVSMASVKSFLDSRRVIVTGVIKDKAGDSLVSFEMELYEGEKIGFRTMTEHSPGWAHEQSSGATGDNAGSTGGDSM
jgi:hypothetical protein